MERPAFINPNMNFNLLGAGRRANAYEVGGQIIKEIRLQPRDNREVLLDQLQKHYVLLKEFMDPYVVGTSFIVGKGEKRDTIFIHQSKIDGMSLQEAISHGKQAGGNLRDIKRFLLKAQRMRSETGYIPDLFGVFSRANMYRWYNPLYTRNVVVTHQDNEFIPHLVDTNFSHRSERVEGRIVHNRLLSFGISCLLQQL